MVARSKITTISWQEHSKTMNELEPYIELLEGAEEHQEVVAALYNLPNIDYLSEEFQQAYYKEMKNQLEWFKENTEILEMEAQEVVTKIPGGKYLKYAD